MCEQSADCEYFDSADCYSGDKRASPELSFGRGFVLSSLICRLEDRREALAVEATWRVVAIKSLSGAESLLRNHIMWRFAGRSKSSNVLSTTPIGGRLNRPGIIATPSPCATNSINVCNRCPSCTTRMV